MRRMPQCQLGMVAASERTLKRSDASIGGGRPPDRHHQRHGLEIPTSRCRDRLSKPFAWIAPPNRGSLNSPHIFGTHVPVEEPSTASKADIADVACGQRVAVTTN